MKDLLKLSLTLAVICAVAGAALAATYSITSAVIVAREKAELTAALSELLPRADAFEETTRDGAVIFLATSGGRPAGAVIPSTGGGYAGPISLLVAIDAGGIVQAVRVTAQRETPGIGDRVTGAAFLGQFSGKTGADPLTVGRDVQVITGATMSVRGVTTGVRNALTLFQVHVQGGEPPLPPDKFTRDLATIADGEFQGEGQGLFGPIRVAVTVRGGRIEGVRVLAHQDTPDYANDAFADLTSTMTTRQDPEVDVVTGATGSSEGFINAVIDALTKAPGR